ncbi:ABC transporter substrate-binding protein [Polycladidibacter hongkongensis]|uniref:ABC transporter substrate-binding protein n=1 Tax=Polycladidibacter hongkongensis TaxID=1647556 RepID=UPI0008346619|nr:ABC transporter substrate-binding protein [Pseudovibrio hongkongensis]
MAKTNRALIAAAFCLVFLVSPAIAQGLITGDQSILTFPGGQKISLQETPMLRPRVGKDLPPIELRIPLTPHITDVAATGREPGEHGGTLRTLIGRAKDARLVNAWGYARLVGYNDQLQLEPDILLKLEVFGERRFTLHLRRGHRWSDGAPFTTEDVRFWWQDIALNKSLRPGGPPAFMRPQGQLPRLILHSSHTVTFDWPVPNPLFLPELAKARPPFIYRPAHYLRKFHADYVSPAQLQPQIQANKVRGWAPLFNRLDDMYGASNPDLPSLQPWRPLTGAGSRSALFIRNPFFHRIDSQGRQLPYIDRIRLTVVDSKLIATKTQAGESDLQARGLRFSDIAVLKQAEERESYQTNLWEISKGAQISLLPNLNLQDPVLGPLMRSRRFRHALSLAIDRRLINKVLYFGLAIAGNDTVLGASPLYRSAYRHAWASYSPRFANGLLDELGLTQRRVDGIRLLPDGRPLQIIVETAGENAEEIDALELVREMWREIGVDLFIKPSQRDVIRARARAGLLQMSVWSGFENGVPTADMPPVDYAPTRSDFLSWASWGAYYESDGRAGSKPSLPEANELLRLYEQWLSAVSKNRRAQIWRRMLTIHAAQTFHIGLVTGVRQPVVVKGLRNVPTTALYGWEPGAQFGIHRMDLFFKPQIPRDLKQHSK